MFTLTKILNEVYEEELKNSKDVAHKAIAWRSSGLGSCMRGQFLGRLLSGDFKVVNDRRTTNVFKLGNIIEDIKVEDTAKHPEYIMITQGEMYDPVNNLTGHFDMLLIHKKTHEPRMFEIKSKNSTAFTWMDKKKEGANHHHKLQIKSYIDMVNTYGFALSDKDSVAGNPMYDQLFAGYGSIVGYVPWTDKRNDNAGKPVWKISQIHEGSIFYVSKDDQRELEYFVQANDSALEAEYKTELDMLNDAWKNHKVLPMYEKTAWQCKYCNYCKAGLCEKLNSKEVIDALFETVELENNKRELGIPVDTAQVITDDTPF